MAHFNTEMKENYLLIRLHGEITIGCSLSFKNDLKESMAENKCYDILVDLKEVTFMDSSGLGLLISLFKEVNENNGHIVFFNMQDYILKLVRLVRLDQVFLIAMTEDEAAFRLSELQKKNS